MAALDTVLHSTLEMSRKNLQFAWTASNPLTAYMLKNKKIKSVMEGREITNPIAISDNPNVGTYSYYGNIPITQTSEFITARYNPSRFAGNVIISGQEITENKGATKIFDLMEAKMKVLDMSIRQKFASYIFGYGVGDDPLGLPVLIPDNPNVGVVGGIDRATNPRWRTTSLTYALTVDNIEDVLDDMWMELSTDGQKPDLIIVGKKILKKYKSAIRDKFTIDLAALAKGKEMLDLGFEGVSFNGIPMMYDENCPANKAYFINTEHLKMHTYSDCDMKSEKLIGPMTQDVTGSRVIWQGQLCLWNAYRRHGVLIDSGV